MASETLDIIVGRYLDPALAAALIDDLVKNGHALPPGGETREEWSTEATIDETGGHGDEVTARRWLDTDAKFAERNPDLPVALLRRTVHIGPWIEAS